MIARSTITKTQKAKLEISKARKTPYKTAKHPDTRILFRSNVWIFLCFLIQKFTLPSPAHTLYSQNQALQLPQLYELRVYHCILTIHLTYSGARQRATTHNTGLRK